MARSRYGIPECCRSMIGDAITRLIPLQCFLQLAAKSFGGERLRQEIHASIEYALVDYGIPSVTGHIDDLGQDEIRDEIRSDPPREARELFNLGLVHPWNTAWRAP